MVTMGGGGGGGGGQGTRGVKSTLHVHGRVLCLEYRVSWV